MSAYAELSARSNFSFLAATADPERLVAVAAERGYAAIAVCDECSFAGVVRAQQGWKDLPADGRPQLILGTRLVLEEGDELVLLAADRAGYAAISQLITRGRRAAAKGEYRLDRAGVLDGLDGGVRVIWQVPAAGGITPAWLLAAARPWLGVVAWLDGLDGARAGHARRLAAAHDLPITALGDTLMAEPEEKPLLDVVTALRHRTTVMAAADRLPRNAERHLRPVDTLADLFPAAWRAEAVRLAGECRFSIDELAYEYPLDDIPPGVPGHEHLRRLTLEGAAERWPEGVPPKVVAQIEHELAVIREMAFEPYFLTVHDIVRFARSRDILCQGRGSAANSAVCFALGITAVNPAESSMLFERFISKERAEPPDIDVDFEHHRREEVMQYIYRRYGRDRAALAATVIRYRRRSALRDAARALGIGEDVQERVNEQLAWWDREVSAEKLAAAGIDGEQRRIRWWLEIARQLTGMPRHLSQHVGGFVIARGQLADLVPVENASMADRTVIQWDKDDLDAVGLMKIDVLALGMLSAVRRAFALANRHRPREQPLALWSIPREDPATFEMISRADTVGVFQIESRAQMSMLPRLQPRSFYDLVIEIAIVRPGPIQGEMVHPYLKRRQGLEPEEYPNDDIRRVLGRTLGVPIFQEQVIELAMVAAGFSAGEADQLRRALGAWRKRGTLEDFRRRLYDGMTARGFTPDFADRVYRQILGFGEYGFPESHSASFAVIAYASAWLKCHEPVAFYCALLNSQPMGFYGPSQLVQDARRHGVVVRPPCVLASQDESTLEPLAGQGNASETHALRLGLDRIRGLSAGGIERLLAARRVAPFRQVADCVRRARLDARDRRALAQAGAFAGLEDNRHAAHWAATGIPDDLALEAGLPADRALGESAVELPAPDEAQTILADYQRLGLSLNGHPLALLRERLRRLRLRRSDELKTRHDGAHTRYCGLVTMRQRPGTAKGTVFLTLEDEAGTVNVIVWPDRVAEYQQVVVGARLLEVRGQWQHREGVAHLIARVLVDHSDWLGRLPARSRDFH
ncbi:MULTISPECIES: error-prone DNA polymerase [unclassified Guyparkeria]|uniref:error-prone DNA polymerase n=1 Tax=unclassified Guyparkeria TaxID=2626246 RepID=UPI0007337B18|nr:MULTISPECIES: error-prone DNA polymerase [unclassified Guyparkeria]KTG17243.1 error-prone DNA polymerase [Guyparkeria sp. XI15]OAE87220.1 error-prone DNA polymerase [Guyparkeria sp. WRN-7]